MGNDRYGGTLVFDEDDQLEPSVYCAEVDAPEKKLHDNDLADS